MTEISNPDPGAKSTPVKQNRSFFLTDALRDYVLAHSARPDEIQESLIQETAMLGSLASMQVDPDQGIFLSLLVSAIQPRLAIEVGTFTGYSSLAIARALPTGGRLLCCDVSEEWTAVARRHWESAGVDDRIDLILGPAADTLAELPDEVEIDFAFIDANKGGYLDYYEALLPRLTSHGLMAIDNVLWSGRVVDPAAGDPDTAAIRAFNDHVAADRRAEAVMLTVGDGVTLVRRHS